MSLLSSMSEFRREPMSWLSGQTLWRDMAPEERAGWLEYRERVTLQYEDRHFLREQEQRNMEQQDVVEMSKYTWDVREPGEAQSLKQYQEAWRILGGDPNVQARLQQSERCSTVLADATDEARVPQPVGSCLKSSAGPLVAAGRGPTPGPAAGGQVSHGATGPPPEREQSATPEPEQANWRGAMWTDFGDSRWAKQFDEDQAWVRSYKEGDALPQPCRCTGCTYQGHSWYKLRRHIIRQHGLRAARLRGSYLDVAGKRERQLKRKSKREEEKRRRKETACPAFAGVEQAWVEEEELERRASLAELPTHAKKVHLDVQLSIGLLGSGERLAAPRGRSRRPVAPLARRPACSLQRCGAPPPCIRPEPHLCRQQVLSSYFPLATPERHEHGARGHASGHP